jgi:DNA-binding Lrp family transcriptional regulator
MTITRISKTEKAILRQLELNARMPFSKIGKRLRMSQQRVSYAVDTMIKKNIIETFYTLIDYSKFDIMNFRVYFRVNYTTQEEFDKLIQYLKAEPSTSWIANCGGRYDLICTFLAFNPSRFNKTLKNIMRNFPAQLENYTILTTIVSRSLGRKYLFSKLRTFPPQAVIGGDRKPVEVKEPDLKILSLLAENARLSAVEIARQLDLTPKTVIERIKKLHQRQIIVSFKPALNTRQIDNVTFLLAIKEHNVVPEIEDQLIDYLKFHPNVVNVVKTLGEWDMEIQIEVENWDTFRSTVREIRQKFKSLIQNTENIPIYKTYHKINYFPGFLLEQNGPNEIRTRDLLLAQGKLNLRQQIYSVSHKRQSL